MDTKSHRKWNSLYAARGGETPARPSHVLQQHAHWLPHQGRALDYASGRGGNALLLSQHGLYTHAWDISSVALQQLDSDAKTEGLNIECLEVDLQAHQLDVQSFDVIVCSYYLDRNKLAEVNQALRPEGLLFYETFNETVPAGKGPSNPNFLLRQAELLQCFSELQILYYEELWHVSDSVGSTGVSRLVARRNKCQ